ncbi:MAG: exodeoxyribonuclease III [Pseudomonadota bacterium]|jgi:exodeoxyribonuclease-3
MRIATWNINSLKVRLPQVLDWIKARQPDVLCLQEIKLEDCNFPAAELEAAGYHCLVSGQKTYNGVAFLSRLPGSDVVRGIPEFADDQKRLIAASFGGVRILCAYFPNGQSVGSDKYEYKLRWIGALRDWLGHELQVHPRLVLAGDFNIAPEGRDVHDPTAWEGQVLFSEPERAAFRALEGLGLKDAFRLFEQPEKVFTWWDYRMMAFRRNMGLRIDHILLSEPLVPACKACFVDKEPRKAERPSDHAPVVADLELPQA